MARNKDKKNFKRSRAKDRSAKNHEPIVRKPSLGSLTLKTFKPLTDKQEELFYSFLSDQYDVISAIGCAGTGKTFLSLYLAFQKIFDKNSDYKRLVIIRSQVSVRDPGHLPGTKEEKASAYELPYKAICTELFGRGDAYEILKQNKIIEFETTSFLQGITLDDGLVVLDEAQNCNFQELDMIISRMGDNGKIFLCGDIVQSHLKEHGKDTCGLVQFFKILDNMKCSSRTVFEEEDIVRSGLVKEYIIAKNKIMQ